jgi:hypothetical protein
MTPISIAASIIDARSQSNGYSRRLKSLRIQKVLYPITTDTRPEKVEILGYYITRENY